jgi:hypothetical protein
VTNTSGQPSPSKSGPTNFTRKNYAGKPVEPVVEPNPLLLCAAWSAQSQQFQFPRRFGAVTDTEKEILTPTR